MSFFMKTFCSILGLSNSQSQSTPLRRNFPTRDRGLSVISTTGDIEEFEAPANVLDSIAIRPTVIAGESLRDSGEGHSRPNEDAGQVPTTGDDALEYAAPVGFEIRADGFATWTAHLGLESSSEKEKGSNLLEEPPPPAETRSRSTMPRARREKVTVKNFPPLLSTLNQNGRPRFSLKKVRKDCRLEIVKVPNEWPGVVRTPCGDGGLKTQFIDADQGDDEDVGGDGKQRWQKEAVHGGLKEVAVVSPICDDLLRQFF
ncbi:uncharacterized protein LOC132268559 [Cornus florida]|uniref:uncharacterized protein LOC132268559 n=1 Tax=Cornus florida TaxID=4283 RepID=UPI0028A19C48|nr:uncharacterized protein LOC132268559 [Cornus florida]